MAAPSFHGLTGCKKGRGKVLPPGGIWGERIKGKFSESEGRGKDDGPQYQRLNWPAGGPPAPNGGGSNGGDDHRGKKRTTSICRKTFTERKEEREKIPEVASTWGETCRRWGRDNYVSVNDAGRVYRCHPEKGGEGEVNGRGAGERKPLNSTTSIDSPPCRVLKKNVRQLWEGKREKGSPTKETRKLRAEKKGLVGRQKGFTRHPG